MCRGTARLFLSLFLAPGDVFHGVALVSPNRDTRIDLVKTDGGCAGRSFSEWTKWLYNGAARGGDDDSRGPGWWLFARGVTVWCCAMRSPILSLTFTDLGVRHVEIAGGGETSFGCNQDTKRWCGQRGFFFSFFCLVML